MEVGGGGGRRKTEIFNLQFSLSLSLSYFRQLIQWRNLSINPGSILFYDDFESQESWWFFWTYGTSFSQNNLLRGKKFYQRDFEGSRFSSHKGDEDGQIKKRHPHTETERVKRKRNKICLSSTIQISPPTFFLQRRWWILYTWNKWPLCSYDLEKVFLIKQGARRKATTTTTSNV